MHAAPAVQVRILDVHTDKARYAPGEPVAVHVVLQKAGEAGPQTEVLKVRFSHLGEPVGPVLSKAICVSGAALYPVEVQWTPPERDFTGYFVDVRLTDAAGSELARSQTAVDVSSEWNRFPRYGYVAEYSTAEGVRPAAWIADLNEFHIDGLQFYNFQNRHEQPLAGTVAHPDSSWSDIAGRKVQRTILDGYLAAARQHSMMTMAYNSAYSVYADAFTDGSGVRLRWATWNSPKGPRTLKTAKAFNLPTDGKWKTHRLIYMNESSSAWENYIFGRMAQLFQVYPFDGWQIDTYGTRGAYAYDRSYVDFISGFRPFVNHASRALHKRMVLNTVGTLGQRRIARSKADFVYSELWDQHKTYDSILAAADQVHEANPKAGLVFAAYIHRSNDKTDPPATTRNFNKPSVLLADATIFASGASHIELGDGDRMLSSDYFPNDLAFLISPSLHSALRSYYDFLTAYENILRYEVKPLHAKVELAELKSSPDGVPDTIWYIGRQKGDRIMVHLINLLGSDNDRWRDVHVNRPDAPLVRQIRTRIYVPQTILSANWASPDCDGGRFHLLSFTKGFAGSEHYVEVVLPSLKYWDVIVLKTVPKSAVM